MEKVGIFAIMGATFLVGLSIISMWFQINHPPSQDDLIQKRVKELYIEYKACELVEKMFSEQTE